MLAELALRFGPAELFWISIFGITIIASLGGGSILKGLIAGAVGLWLSTIGYNPVLGEERFVFSEHLAAVISPWADSGSVTEKYRSELLR